MKRCGKSAPRSEQSDWQGKPHVKQDQIGEEEWPAPLELPGRSLEPFSNGGPRRMVATASAGTETGLQIAQAFYSSGGSSQSSAALEYLLRTVRDPELLKPAVRRRR